MMTLASISIMLSGGWMFCSKRKFILLTLLSLEFMVVGVYLIMLMGLGDGGLLFSLIYLSFSACEGALGLSILVTMSRTHGGDSFNLFNLN